MPPYCTLCPHTGICLPADLDTDELKRFEDVILKQKSLERGQYLFCSGDAFKGLFAIRSGCFKTTVIYDEGSEHVQHFHLAGELIGFDAVYQSRHASSAIALSDASACYISFATMMQLAEQFLKLQFRLFRLFSRYALRTSSLTGDYSAEERVAAFLLSLSARLSAAGSSASELDLAMSREDIANHLRLASETVSRVLAKFKMEHLIDVKGKRITLIRLDGLRELAARMVP